MYIDLDYFIITEAQFEYEPSGYVNISIKAEALICKDLYNEWAKTKSNKSNVKLKGITDGNIGHKSEGSQGEGRG